MGNASLVQYNVKHAQGLLLIVLNVQMKIPENLELNNVCVKINIFKKETK